MELDPDSQPGNSSTPRAAGWADNSQFVALRHTSAPAEQPPLTPISRGAAMCLYCGRQIGANFLVLGGRSWLDATFELKLRRYLE